MTLLYLFKGLLIGFAIAAPVGPIGLLCIQRTLTRGRGSGIISGLGAASADAVYGTIAGFGVVSISGLLLSWQEPLRISGALFLFYLGWDVLRSAPVDAPAPLHANDWLGDYLSTFALTLTNPITILSFIAIFAGLGLSSTGRDYTAAAMLVLGVFLGSLLWWLLLGLGIGALRHHLTSSTRRWINRGAGTAIIAFGAAALLL